ncbi:MAG: hypothetical protein IK085_09035 [Clostridia bacterium]|nr:hypothetical protein [Clostridia bacterium]
MKHTFKKSISLFLALAMVLSLAFSAGAVNFSETKANAFIKKLAAEKAITVTAENISQDPLEVKDVIATIKLKDEKSVDIKASGSVKLSSLSANVFYDGKNLDAYLWIFKINVSKLLKDATGEEIMISADQQAEIAGIFSEIVGIADSPLLAALSVDSKTDTTEKFSVSAMSLLVSMSGASEEAVTAAMAAAGYETKDKTDKEIKDMLVAANKAGALLPILKAAGAKVTQEDLDFCMEYIYDTFEFTYSGNDIKDIAVYDENGGEVFRLSKLIPIGIKSIAAGEGKVKKAPAFGIDITGLASGLLKGILSGLM